ncbi:hypothetical protein A2U01_0116899 [Trifolium medium]|uniref:Uncharacterized protein n=1 Tax=Trifolium medium TaxID=97028 RepID=A0A392W8Y8_9FABA|nr:hypothetical protein [Trifolium medium]
MRFVPAVRIRVEQKSLTVAGRVSVAAIDGESGGGGDEE